MSQRVQTCGTCGRLLAFDNVEGPVTGVGGGHITIRLREGAVRDGVRGGLNLLMDLVLCSKCAKGEPWEELEEQIHEQMLAYYRRKRGASHRKVYVA
jgi:hypothetical protein